MVCDILPSFFLANHPSSGGVVHHVACSLQDCYKYSHKVNLKHPTHLHSCIWTVREGESTQRGRGHKDAEKPLRYSNLEPSCSESRWLVFSLHVLLHGNHYQVWVELVCVVQSW